MSNLRIFGIIVSILGLFFTFRVYRGERWNRTNFIFFIFFNLGLGTICINPDSINFVRDILSFQQYQYGRLIALVVISNITIWFFFFYMNSKQENMRFALDRIIRGVGVRNLQDNQDSMNKIKEIMVLIPAYNEGKNLRELLPKMPKQIQGKSVGVLVVDDGSEDDTVEAVKENGYLLVSNLINRGQGAASRLGYDILKKHNVAIGVTMDGDNQHRPEDIETLVQLIITGEKDLVIGSRVLGCHVQVSWLRSMGVTSLSWIINFMTGLNITDCSSGFKAFNVKKIGEINLLEDQFQSSEVLIESCKKGLQIGEVPITINDRKFGHSKKGTDFGYGFNFAKTIVKTWWRKK